MVNTVTTRPHKKALSRGSAAAKTPRHNKIGCIDLYNFMFRRFYDREFIFHHILEEIRIIYPVYIEN